MIRLLTLAALATLATAPLAAAAQSAPATAPSSDAPASTEVAPPHAHRMGRVARALRELDLTPDQHARARSAMAAYRASRSTATPETRAQLRASLDTILTPEQRTRFDAAMRRPAPQPVATPA